MSKKIKKAWADLIGSKTSHRVSTLSKGESVVDSIEIGKIEASELEKSQIRGYEFYL